MTRNEFFDSLEREVARIKYQLSLTRGEIAICLEMNGKDMTDVYKLQQEIEEKDVIINFLKKELQHKISYRQAMKKQYRELKQKYESEKEKLEKMKNYDNCKHSHVCNAGLVMELDRKDFGEPCNKCKDYSKWEIKNVWGRCF